jgi:peptide/nickel transport system substrate-binding protein
VPNKFYYDKTRIRWGKIVVKAITDPNTVLAAMRTGQIDVMYGADARTESVAIADGIKVDLSDVSGFEGIDFWDRGGEVFPALGDVRVRRALNYAVDRKKILSALVGRGGIPSSISMRTDGFDPKYDNYYTYDPDKAKALLAAAGYANGFTFNVLALGAWAAGYDTSKVALAMAKDLAAVGVKMVVDAPASVGDFINGYNNRKTYGGIADVTSVFTTWQWYSVALIPSDSDGDQHGFHDPVIDKLWLRAQRLSEKQAAPLWRQIMDRSVTQAYFIPIGQIPYVDFYLPRVGGVTPATLSRPTDWYPAGR